MYEPYVKKTTPLFSCAECDYSTSHQDDLQKHLRKRHNDIPAIQILPPKIARHEPIPNIINPTKNEQFLQDIEQQEIRNMLKQNTQVGFGINK